MEEPRKRNRKEKYYEFLSLKNLSPEQWDELPEWEDLSEEINLLVDSKAIEY